MTSAGRRAVGRATEVMRGATGQLVRHPAFVVILLLLAGVGGGWYWKQRQAKGDETGLSAASVGATGAVPSGVSAPSAVAPGTPSAGAADPSVSAAPAAAPGGVEAGSAPAAGGAVPADPSGASASSAVATGAAAAGPAPGSAGTSASGMRTGSASGGPGGSTGAPGAAGAASGRPGTAGIVAKTSGSTPGAATNHGGTVAAANTAAVAEPTPVVPEKPAMPVMPDVKLENTITLLTPKDDDVEETEGTLTLHGNEIVIIDEDDKVVRTVRLRADGPGKGPAASGPAQIYTHRRDRWLVLPLAGDRLVVQVDRDDIPKLIAALETRLGRPVTTVDGEPKFPKH
jgi:hypothetical protein